VLREAAQDPFIGARRRFGGEGKYPPRRPAAEGPRQGRFGKITGMAGEVPFGIRGVELWDMTRRAGGWAMAATVAVWRGQRLRGWW
jgi:hypothetical protein